jgi:hypothetical protein
MKTGILAGLLLSVLSVSGQYNGNKEMRHHGMLLIQEYDLPVNGSPYLNDIYKKGTITVRNPEDTLKQDKLMRFNAFTGDIEYLGQNEKPQNVLKRENIEVALDGQIFEVHPYRVNGIIYRGFFVPLNPGEPVVLYKKPLKHYRKPALPEHGYEEARKPEYFDASEYYIQIAGEGMVPVRLNRKSILKSLGSRENALKSYISDKRLNLKNPEDVVNLISYYNALATTH